MALVHSGRGLFVGVCQEEESMDDGDDGDVNLREGA
jgi:hypothetical protein